MRRFNLRLFLLSGIAAAGVSNLAPSQAALCDGVSPARGTDLATVRIASGLNIPCLATAPPGDVHRVFIVEQDGRIRIVKDGVLLGTPFLDVTSITRAPGDGGGDEQGLLGLAFSPTYESDGLFFVYHTDTSGGSNLVERFRVSANPDVADSSTRTLVITLPHPTFGNHNGGNMQFGGDGYLYIGTGDGGDACDPGDEGGNAQNTNDLRGKLLRIDVIPPPVPPASPYRIPPGQPEYSKPEIFSIGLRNPWRWSFDRQTQDLYIADVGQNSWEEVSYVSAAAGAAGKNFGWQNYEGLECPAPGCDGGCTTLEAHVSPVKVYSHEGGCSITGGFVYRGCRMPDLAVQGRYFYADYCAANLESFVVSGGVVTSEQTVTSQLSPAIGNSEIDLVTSWGEDGQGELYVVDRDGDVFKIVPVLAGLEVSGRHVAGAAAPPAFRRKGSAWTWEDLAASSSHPIEFYRVYRHEGKGDGSFDCVYKTPAVTPPARPATSWPGGDPATPPVGALYSYVVTAVRMTSRPGESSPGRATDGTQRTLTTVACP